MHRNNLIQLLDTYKPSTSEVESKQRILSFISKNSECFERSLLAGHITASAFLIDKKGDKALLMHHAKLDKWVQLGGHCDGDPDVKAVALKEAQEESGIKGIKIIMPDIFDISIHDIPMYKNVPAHTHYDVRFLLQVISDEQIIQNSESNALQWFFVDDPLPTQSFNIIRMFEKWKAFTQHQNAQQNNFLFKGLST